MIGFLGTASASLLALAQGGDTGFSFTYLEVRGGYTSLAANPGLGGTAEAAGILELNGSIELGSVGYFTAGYRGTELEGLSSGVGLSYTLNSARIGAGYHVAAGEQTDFHLDASILLYDAETVSNGGFVSKVDDEVLVLGTGLRHRLSPSVEIESRLLFELEKQRTKVEIGPRIDVTPNLQLGVIYETGITPEGLDVNSALFTARLAF
jgi:hypothetical protein